MVENDAHGTCFPPVPMSRQPTRAPMVRPGSVRIIAGHWRGSRLPVPDRPGLRPTSDRVRETLFNWLQPVLPGARVLDLFAGSGALGLEAASRGAAHVQLVEADPGLARSLMATVERLQGQSRVAVHCGDALAFLRAASPEPAWDIAFVDPPFAAGLWPAVLELLPPRLATTAWLYLETPAEYTPVLPPDWAVHRENRTRQVRYALYRRGTLGA